MDNDYITIKEAEELTGKSDETIRRWVRLMRSSYQVDPNDANEQLEAKRAPLRKQNIRLDKHGVQQFDWLLSRADLLETYVNDIQSPIHNSFPNSNDDPRPQSADGHEDRQKEIDDTHDTPQQNHDPRHADTQKIFDPVNDDPQESRKDPLKVNADQDRGVHDEPVEPPHDPPQNNREDHRSEVVIDRRIYEALLSQLDVKDDQLKRKDQQLDSALDRTKETNYLLRGYQERFGALGAPAEPKSGGEQ